MSVQPVILCGGSGLRLWPLSTQKVPKQFIKINNSETLLESTVKRINNFVDIDMKPPILIMNVEHELPESLSDHKDNVVYEPYANDTAVAIARATLAIKNKYPTENPILLIVPSDHYIGNTTNFTNDIMKGLKSVNNNIILYGIQPTSPETKYGYITPHGDSWTMQEKPDYLTAMNLIQQNALWNSGIFVANVDLLLSEFKKCKFDILDWVNNPRNGKAPSFDIAILQEYNNLQTCKCSDWCWSDVGTWDAFIDIQEIKKEIELSNVRSSKCSNVKVLDRATNKGQIVVIGCDDILVVLNKDDILIMSTKDDYSNDLKQISSNISS